MELQSAVIARQELVDAAERIEPLPPSVTRLLSLTNDPNSTADDLAQVIRYDPVLTLDLLRRANSARSAVRDPIVEVPKAIARLGSAEVMAVAVKRAVHGRMTVALPAYGMDAQELWRHSLSSAIAAEVISEHSSIRIPGHANTAALLHDVGKLVISKALPKELAAQLARAIATDPRPLHEVERSILGTDHGAVGATVIRAWDMPMSIQMALTNHHNLPESPDILTHVVVAANAVALALPTNSQPNPDPLDHQSTLSLSHVGVVGSQIPTVIAAVAERLQQVVGVYEV